MYSLILDSSTKVLYCALVCDNEIIYEKYLEGKNDHAKAIVLLVDEATKKANIDVDKIDEVVVGYGPGSYTGVRMAVTVSKMISSFMNKPLYTISTLKLMASGTKGNVLAMIDARRGNCFGAVINDGSFIVEEKLDEINKFMSYPHDAEALELSFRVDPFVVLKNKELVENPDLLVPNYLRETEAERNLHD